MENTLENEIITAVEKAMVKYESCSIKQVANSIFNNNITLSEQKHIAKLIVKKHPFVTEIKNGEIIVKKNALFSESKNDTKERYDLIKYFIWIITAICAHLVFHVLLPGLSK